MQDRAVLGRVNMLPGDHFIPGFFNASLASQAEQGREDLWRDQVFGVIKRDADCGAISVGVSSVVLGEAVGVLLEELLQSDLLVTDAIGVVQRLQLGPRRVVCSRSVSVSLGLGMLRFQ